MQQLSIDEAIDQILKRDPRYPREAYHFIREALDFTIKRLKKGGSPEERHISGQELLEGTRKYALEHYGPLAFTVLSYWNLNRCEDIGELVFNMVEMRI